MLKQYCELDTLAMVMILEFMLDEITSSLTQVRIQ